ncbi:MAG: ABC transporter permease, partial [Acidobacteriota bacterium]
LGVRPLLGRGFNSEEDREGGPRALLLSHALWNSQFGGNPQIVGQVVEYQELQHTIVGVMPEGFYFPAPDCRFWVTLQGNDLLKRAGIEEPGRALTFILVMGRLGSEVGLAAAQAELQSLNDQIEEEYSLRHREILLIPRLEAVVGDVSPLLWTLLASVGLVLLIACANVANLSLSRAASRQKEMALRNALGAPRRRLMRQMLTESALLAGIGAMLAVAVAAALVGWLASAGGALLPRSQEIALNREVLLFTAAIAILSSLLFGLIPALRSSRPQLQSALQVGGRSSGGASPRLQKGLVVCQVALALVLLSGAGLLVNSFIRLTSVSIGFRPDGLLTLWLSLPEERYPGPDAVIGFYENLLARLQALPEVEKASYSYSLPFTGNVFRQTVVAEGMEAQGEERHWAGTVIVGPRHFETMGITLLEGRDFDRRDRFESAPAAIVNQAMARRYWPDEKALGKRFRRDGGVDGSLDTTRYFRGRPWITVVGVAADVSRTGFQDPPAPEFYIPHAQMPWASTSLVLRSRGEPLELVEPVRRIVVQQDARIALHDIDSMQQRMDRSVLPQRLRTQLWTLFALLASSLAVIGVYGVMAFGVSRRTQEIGVRMALGAGRGRVLRLVLSQGMRLAVLGALLGLLGALAANRALSGLLYEVSASDPLTYALVAALLLGVAALACYLPARRASRVDPLIALRWE